MTHELLHMSKQDMYRFTRSECRQNRDSYFLTEMQCVFTKARPALSNTYSCTHATQPLVNHSLVSLVRHVYFQIMLMPYLCRAKICCRQRDYLKNIITSQQRDFTSSRPPLSQSITYLRRTKRVSFRYVLLCTSSEHLPFNQHDVLPNVSMHPPAQSLFGVCCLTASRKSCISSSDCRTRLEIMLVHRS